MKDLLISCALLLMGTYLIVINWMIFYSNYVKKKHSSWAPLLGGLLTAIGLVKFPLANLSKYAWIPFVADYGCAIGLAHTAWFWIFKCPKIKKDP